MERFDIPVFFRENRVFRVYLGGKKIGEFTGRDMDEKDDFYPEEWIASDVQALNAGERPPHEGVSVTEDGTLFTDLLAAHPKEMLGERKSPGVLVKYLDSAIRLPMQVHPTRAFSREHFGSPYGKAESWVILDTRPDACIYFAFRDGVTADDLRRAVHENMENPGSFLPLVNRVPVKTGDVFFVPAGMIHAIGAGCMILEAQEPTDFTIQPEAHCGDYILSEHEMYLTLDEDTALSCFDLSYHGQYGLSKGRVEPRAIRSENGVTVECLIGDEQTDCFSVTRYRLTGGSVLLDRRVSVCTVTGGEATLTGPGYSRRIKKGEYFFLPEAAREITMQGTAELIVAAGGKAV